MKLVGHTMGTPDISIIQAIDLFSGMGFDGIEIRCGEPKGMVTVGEKTYPVEPFSPEWKEGNFHLGMEDEEFRRIKERAREKRLEIVTLTPYIWDINVEDRSMVRANIEEFRRYVELAERLEARYVRVFSGREIKGSAERKAWDDTVAALREMADFAGRHGIMVILENHSGTMTPTGRDTARMIAQIDRPNVRVLLDIVNVLIDGKETWEEALESQRQIIEYLHVKDIVMIEGAQHPRVMGRGIVPWKEIFARLLEYGFDGCLSLEYELRWHRGELPPAAEGMLESKKHVQLILSRLSG